MKNQNEKKKLTNDSFTNYLFNCCGLKTVPMKKKYIEICIWIISHERAETRIKYADASTELAVSIATSNNNNKNVCKRRAKMWEWEGELWNGEHGKAKNRHSLYALQLSSTYSEKIGLQAKYRTQKQQQ